MCEREIEWQRKKHPTYTDRISQGERRRHRSGELGAGGDTTTRRVWGGSCVHTRIYRGMILSPAKFAPTTHRHRNLYKPPLTRPRCTLPSRYTVSATAADAPASFRATLRPAGAVFVVAVAVVVVVVRYLFFCVHTHIHVNSHTHTQTHTDTNRQTHNYTHTHTYTQTQTNTYDIHTHTCVHKILGIKKIKCSAVHSAIAIFKYFFFKLCRYIVVFIYCVFYLDC